MSQPAGPAYVVPGIAVTPEVVEDEDGTEYPAYFRPALATSLNASLLVADPRTGEDVANAGRAVYSSPPRRCDDGIDVCFESGSALQGAVTRRLPLSHGIVVEEPQAPGYVRGVGPLGLSDVRDKDRVFLARIENGVERWRTPIDDAFGPEFSTDGGWAWEHFEDAGLLVGWVGKALVGPLDGEQVLDLANFPTVALDADSGEVVWRHEGSTLSCLYTLPRPRIAVDDDPAPVRCAYRGVLTLRPGGDPTFRDVDVVVEGFDLRTGRTTWQVPMGAAEELVYGGGAGGVARTVLAMATPVGDHFVLATTVGLVGDAPP